MYFKRLEIFGFKSFAEKTTLSFEPGITAVVGPNGCGKSNVFDAIRWVLGEQSMKQLRGSSREDVIFNGTDKRPPLGFAEVSVTFSNEQRSLPIEYDEVTVTRRLYRSGESEYLINKSQVRLKDIQDLILGTGIGAQAYSMVQQGRVDMVVNAKPEDRRNILDEASGITKYKSRKKEALGKLKSTDANLLRVNDIVVEVKRQITSLERQANKARKYKDEFERLKTIDTAVTRRNLERYRAERDALKRSIEENRGLESDNTRQLEELKNRLSHEEGELHDIEEDVSRLREKEIKLDGQIDLNNRQIGFNGERIQQIDLTFDKLREQKEVLIQRCRQQQEKVDEMKRATDDIGRMAEEAAQRRARQQEDLAVIDRVLQEARQKIKDHEEQQMTLTGEQSRLRNELAEVMKEYQTADGRRTRLESEKEKVLVEKDEVDRRLKSTEVQTEGVRKAVDKMELQKAHNEHVRQEHRQSMEEHQTHINELEKKKIFLKSQKEFIEKLRVQYHDIPDPVSEGKFITTIPPQEHHSGIIGKVKNFNPIPASGVDKFRGMLSSGDSSQYYEVTCEAKFIELDPRQVSTRIEQLEKITEESLERQKLYREELLRQDELLQQIDSEIHNKEKTLSVLEAQKKETLSQSTKLAEELSVLSSELTELDETVKGLKTREDEMNYRLETVTQEMEWCVNDIKEKQGTIEQKSRNREEMSVSIAQIETELRSIEEKKRTQEQHRRTMEETLDEWLEQIQKTEEELSGDSGKKDEYAREIESLQSEIEEIRRKKAEIQNDLHEQQARKEEISGRLESDREFLRACEDGIIQAKQKQHKIEFQIQEFEFKITSLLERVTQAYKIDMDAPQDSPPEAEDPLKDMSEEQISEEIVRLRKRCDSFGNVNLVAIEEFEELRERFEFLTQQQSDLIEAKSHLMNTINKINRSTRQMFIETFDKVNEQFRVYFRVLFGGGDAQLVLLDPDNVLECGIDIVAKPPGKKLTNITLLSGGEKTLTAIALIFGVFRVNPSPFCVLDEIDAALDEANVGRFSNLLQDFAEISQFIVITHNKKTIASADIMYGVTMPETGCSRIVSVKFSEQEKESHSRMKLPAGV